MNSQSTKQGPYENAGARHWSEVGQVSNPVPKARPWWLRLAVLAWYATVVIGGLYFKDWLQRLVEEVIR